LGDGIEMENVKVEKGLYYIWHGLENEVEEVEEVEGESVRV